MLWKEEIIKKVTSWLEKNNGFLTSDSLYEILIPFIVEKNLYSDKKGNVTKIESLLKQNFDYKHNKSNVYGWQKK